jgi:hypothetical protein
MKPEKNRREKENKMKNCKFLSKPVLIHKHVNRYKQDLPYNRLFEFKFPK